MTHDHEPHSHDTRVVERDRSGAPLLVAVIAIVVLAFIAFGIFWAAPWDSEGGGTDINIEAPGGDGGEGGGNGGENGGNGGNGGNGEGGE